MKARLRAGKEKGGDEPRLFLFRRSCGESACRRWALAAAASDQRFENWKLRRALALPYFFRSTARLSRVRKPACFTAVRRAGS